MAGYKASQVEQGRVPLPMAARTDAWWVEPALVVVTLVAFSAYAMWRAFEGRFFDTRVLLETGSAWAPALLSPFYSPPIHEWFPTLPNKAAISPAVFVLVFPLSFRLTCYYCRRSYYRAFFCDPPACGMHEPAQERRKRYTGESAFPFILQNLHRYALYFILVVVIFHYIHLYDACFLVNNAGRHRFAIGVGTVIFLADTVLLSLYVFSCHSWRHLVGGCLNRLSDSPLRQRIWSAVSVLNARHGLYFWLSLITVALGDLYVRLVSAGIIMDLRIF